jgi:tetratricopeptide (TPR) repeat protein
MSVSTSLALSGILLWGVGLQAQEKPRQELPKLPSQVDGGIDTGMARLVNDAVKKLAIDRNQEALDRLEQKDHPGALGLLKQAYDLDPENPEVANNLGYLFFILGNTHEGEKYLRRSLALDPGRLVAYVNLADMLGREGESPERQKEAADLLEKAREIHGNIPRVILRQARVARQRHQFEDAMRFYREYVAIRKPTDRLLLEIGDFYREMGKDDEAFGWYQRVTDSNEWGKAAATRIWDIEVERQAKKYGWSARTDNIPEKAKNLVEKGQQLLEQKNSIEARRLFEEAIAISPGYAAARMRLGDLAKQNGEFLGAELAYLRALALDSGNAEIYARLGKLYLNSMEKNRFADAALFLGRALELRPDWTAVHLALAKALQGAGELVGALKHLDLYLVSAPKGEARNEAERLKKTIEKLLSRSRRESTLPALSKETLTSGGLSEELINALNRARAHLVKGRPDAAMAELQRLSTEHEVTRSEGMIVLNFEGLIMHSSGRLEEAAKIFKSSLMRDPKQPEVHEQLGNILEELGRWKKAKQHYLKAEKQGNPTARYFLARLDFMGGEEEAAFRMADFLRIGALWRAKERLDAFIASEKGGFYLDEAHAIRSDILRRFWIMGGVAGGGVILVGIALLFGTRHLWGGVNLTALLTKYPDAGPEVQQVLSAIRHEVLKHNTMALGGVIESLDRGAPDAMGQVRHFKRTLLSPKGNTVPQRLEKYAIELTKIGRFFGLRLNLKQKEPAIRLLNKGFGILVRELNSLNSRSHLRGREKKQRLRSLKKAFRLLNVDGYEAVQQMLGRIRMLEVDESMIRSIAVRVLREPGFSDVDVAPIAIKSAVDWPIGVLISQRAYEDIFANLIRNALQSSVEVRLSPVEVGMLVDLEVDEVTGFERAVFLVCDHSDKILNTEMIRRQAIEGGLGLTVDLVNRYDGMVDVIDNIRGWSKAVRVKLPMAPVLSEEGDES